MYDEDVILEGLERLPLRARVAFAAACAEWLWPLVCRYAGAVSMAGETRDRLREALDLVWAAADGDDVMKSLGELALFAEDLASREDSEWRVESGYGENGIAAIAYAANTALTGASQDAVWAARQLYEAADYAAQQSGEELAGIVSAESLAALEQAEAVQAAVDGIAEVLVAAGTGRVGDLRKAAEEAAVRFAGLCP